MVKWNSESARLLAATQRGDRNALGDLARLEGPRLRAVAFHVGGDEALAEDAVQEAFLRILQGNSPYQGRGSAEGWLVRMVTRIAIDLVRQRVARRRREEGVTVERDRATAADEVLLAEAAEAISRGLDILPLDERAALWLHVVEGEGIREVAECLGTTRSTAHRRVRSGLDVLKRYLKASGIVLPLTAPLAVLLRRLPTPPPSPGFLIALAGLTPGHVSRGSRSPRDAGTSHLLPTKTCPDPPRPKGSARRPEGPHRATIIINVAIGLAGLGGLLGLAWILFPGPGVPLRSSGSPEVHPRVAVAPPPSKKSAPPPPPAPPAPFQIQGRVIDEDGNPVEWAEVRAYEDLSAREGNDLFDRWAFFDWLEEAFTGFPPLAEAKSGAGGAFVLGLPTSRGVHLLALDPEIPPRSSGESRARPGDDRVELVLRPGLTVSGKVETPEGVAVEGARVTILPALTIPKDRDFTSHDFKRLLDRFVPRQEVTDGEGLFRFHAVSIEGERYQVLASAEGRAHARVSLDSPRGEERELQLEVMVLPPAVQLSGSAVRMPGEVPAPSVRVLAFSMNEEDRGWFAVADSGEAGEFTLAAGGEEFRLLAKMPGRLLPASLERGKDRSAERLRIEFPEGISLRGRVRLASDGRPLSGVRVLSRSIGGVFSSAESTTDDEGRYIVEGLPAGGAYDVFPIAAGLMPRDAPAPIPPGAREAVRDIELVPSRSLRGRVLNPKAQPVKGALVEVIATAEDDAEGRRLRWRREVLGQSDLTTDDRGEFVAEDIVPGGKIYVFAYDPSFGECFAGPVEFDTDPRLPGQITVFLQGSGLEVEVLDLEGRPLRGIEFSIVNDVLWSWLPDMMNLGQWLERRTSMDVSRYDREVSLTPGIRRGLQEGEGPVRWTDLMSAPYNITFCKDLAPGDLSNWEQEYWYYMGTLEAPLAPAQLTRLAIALDLHRRVKGTVIDREGKGLEDLRVQVWFHGPSIPLLTKVYGYFVTHSRRDGAFEAFALGPGPYRITAGDRQDRIAEVRGVPEGAEDVKIVWAPGEAGR